MQTPGPQPDKLNREKRVLLTQAEEREIERLVSRLAEELATPVKLSHLLRACVTLLRHTEEQIADHARQTGSLTRPSNGDPAALAEFEFRLAQILSAAFRDAARLR
jgi:DNA repair ATPase RecN